MARTAFGVLGIVAVTLAAVVGAAYLGAPVAPGPDPGGSTPTAGAGGDGTANATATTTRPVLSPTTTDGTDGTATGGNDTDGTADGTGAAPAFALDIEEVTDCGTTCRLVTATLWNVGDANASNVTVVVELSADGDRVWRGEVPVGTLPAGESWTTTERVEVGLGGAAAIRANDGYVTIETTVRHDGDPVTFTDRRKVA